MESLREKLFGKAKPLREKLAEIMSPDMAESAAPETKGSAVTDPLLDAKKKPVEADPVKVEDGALVPQPKIEREKPKAIRSFDVPFIGTNYDPYDPEQTRENPDGKGKAGIVMDDDMVATSLKDDGLTGNLRLGTVIRVPSLNKVFLVADTMNKRFNGMNKIDFVRKDKKKTPDPEVNKEFSDIEIIREGNGSEDARKFVESGEWEMLKKQFED